MIPEDRLDDMIASRQSSRTAVDDDLAIRLAAAETLDTLNRIAVPRVLAERIEMRVRERARALKRDRSSAVPMPARQPRPGHPLPCFLRRTWIAIGSVMAFIVISVGVFAAAMNSLPGDPLYNLKQWENNFAIAHSGSPVDRAQLALDQLNQAIIDLKTEVRLGRSDADIRAALNVVSDDTAAARLVVSSLAQGASRDAAQSHLMSTLKEEDGTLRSLLARIDWPLHVAFTQQLGALGDAVPIIHTGSAHNAEGKVMIVLNGTNFITGATLIVDGVPQGAIIELSPNSIVADLNGMRWSDETHAVGVQNPDGTSAQIMLSATGNNGQPGSGSGHGGGVHATPTPSSTSSSPSHNHPGDATPTPGNNRGNTISP